MQRDELERWLGAGDAVTPTETEVFLLLEDSPDAASAYVRRSIGFVLAVLRDMYVDEGAVWGWLIRPHPELDAPPADLLRNNRCAQLEELIVVEWNDAVTSSRNERDESGQLDRELPGFFRIMPSEARLPTSRAGIPL